MRHTNKHSTQTIIKQHQIFIMHFICTIVGILAFSDNNSASTNLQYSNLYTQLVVLYA